MTTEENSNAKSTGKGTRTTRAARTSSADDTAPRTKLRAAAEHAKENGAGPARQAKDSADAAEKAARSGAASLGAAASHAGRSAATALDSGRKVAATLGSNVTSGAGLAWTVVKDRRKVAAGAGAGFAGLMSAAFAAGRATAKAQGKSGPLTRLTNGRI